MAFDATHHSGGGGGDGHKDPTQDVIEACAAAAALTAKANGVCVDCTMMETGIYIVAHSLALNAIYIKNNPEIHQGDPLKVTFTLVRVVMQQIDDEFTKNMDKIIKEQEGKQT
jgi:hypothetical protein